jgi:hypothetical protein
LHREIETVQTEYGEVQIKVAKSGQMIANVQPEYEDCASIARVKNAKLVQSKLKKSLGGCNGFFNLKLHKLSSIWADERITGIFKPDLVLLLFQSASCF